MPALQFNPHYHPYTCEFIKSLNRYGVPGLLTEANQTLGNPYLHSPWRLGMFGNAPRVIPPPCGPASIIESDYKTGLVGNFEAVVLVEGNHLVHVTHDYSDPGPWKVTGPPITSKAAGPGALLQSSSGIHG